jgi:uncharacterized protein (TIGR02246 family)
MQNDGASWLNRRAFTVGAIAAAATTGCPALGTSEPLPMIVVEPPDALMDVPIVIELKGFTPRQPVTLTATQTFPRNSRWRAHATFTSDDAGDVSVARQAPVSGTYEGVAASSELLQALLAADLIDEFNLLTFPVVLGSGKRLFRPGATPFGLRLIQSRASPTGVIVSRYEPAGAIKAGSWDTGKPSDAEILRRQKLAIADGQSRRFNHQRSDDARMPTIDRGNEATSDEHEIRSLIGAWAEAVNAGDIHGVLAGHSDDVVMFDVPPPDDGLRGIDAYRGSWPRFLEWQANGATFEIVRLDVTPGADVAFAHALLLCGSREALEKAPGNRLRLTIGLRKEDGIWRIAHEHHSFPSRDQD